MAAEQGRDATGVLDHLEPALHLADRVGEHLPVLGREDPRDLLALRVNELADAEHDLRAPRERDGAPALERHPGIRDGLADLLDRREIDLTGLRPDRRVVDGAASPRLAGNALAADPMADPLHARVRGLRCLDGLGHAVSVARLL